MSGQQEQFLLEAGPPHGRKLREHKPSHGAVPRTVTELGREVPERPNGPLRSGAARDGTFRHPMLLTARDIEVELQLGRTRTYELLRSGEIPVIRLGRAVRVSREALGRWIDEHGM